MSNIDQSMEEVLYELVELYLTNPPKDLHSFAFAGMCSLHVIQIFLDKGMTEDEKDFKNLVRRISKIESEQYLLRFEPVAQRQFHMLLDEWSEFRPKGIIPNMEEQYMKPWDEWSDRQKGHITASNVQEE